VSAKTKGPLPGEFSPENVLPYQIVHFPFRAADGKAHKAERRYAVVHRRTGMPLQDVGGRRTFPLLSEARQAISVANARALAVVAERNGAMLPCPTCGENNHPEEHSCPECGELTLSKIACDIWREKPSRATGDIPVV